MAMNLSLSKLPWYGQVGAFVALALAGVGVFWNFYAQPAQASIDARRGAAGDAPAPKSTAAWRPRGACRSSAREVGDARGAARAPASRAARRAGRRRSAAPRPGDGDAVEPDHPRLHAAGGRHAADARRMADRPAARRHAITTSARFLERVSKFPRIINVGGDQDQRADDEPAAATRSPPSARRRRSC